MDVWQAIAEARGSGRPMVVVTVTSVRGSVPGEAGAKMMVGGARPVGTVGGGKIEARVLAEAEAMLVGGERCRTVTWNLQRDIGMTCGGEMSFLFEKVAGDEGWHVVVFGAGHVAQALVRVLAPMRCTVDVIDPREEWLEGIVEAPNVRRHRVVSYEEGVDRVRPASFVVSVTQGHATDRPVLREVLGRFSEVAFLGVIGSASKRAVLMRELKEDGISEERLERIECPVGLPIGGNDPAEIAVSITARLLEARDRSRA